MNSKIFFRRMTAVSTVKPQRRCISSHLHVKNEVTAELLATPLTTIFNQAIEKKSLAQRLEKRRVDPDL